MGGEYICPFATKGVLILQSCVFHSLKSLNNRQEILDTQRSAAN